jgi:HSP20 family protein
MKHEIIIREPELYFDHLHQELNNLLRDVLSSDEHPETLNAEKTWRPAIEVKQNEKNYKVKVQLPGIKKDDIVVDMDNEFMTITARMQEEREEEELKKHNSRYHTQEFRYGKYLRTIWFDSPVKADEARAEYEDGVLMVTVPKQRLERKEPKRILIK